MEFFFVNDDDLREQLQQLEKRRELEAVEAVESDMDLAFRLQLEETMKASIQNLPSTSSSPPQQSKNDGVFKSVPNLPSTSSPPPQQSKNDIVFPSFREDRDPRMDNQRMVREIFGFPERDSHPCRDWWDLLFGESSSGSSSNSVPKNDGVFNSVPNLRSTSSPPPQQSKNDVVFQSFRGDRDLDRITREIFGFPGRESPPPQQSKKDIVFPSFGEDRDRRMENQRIAREICGIPERDSRAWRDWCEISFGESSSGSSGNSKYSRDKNDDVFRVYFKGLVSSERLNLAGIGVVVFDPRKRVVSEIRKPLISDGLNRVVVEAKALIEGLNAAVTLEVKNVEVFFNCHALFQFITGSWPPKQRKIAVLVNQVSHLRRKFTSCRTLFIRNGSKLAFELAKEAIDSHFTGPVESSSGKTVSETCIICLEDTDPECMFSVENCEHRFCFSCMKQHVEVKLLSGMLPQCPHEKCKSALQVESCQKFLPPKLVETMSQRMKEASIPVSEKIYCPYPKCSALMTKEEVTEGGERSGARKCLKCHGLFCINCKVPWHSNMTCDAHKRANPVPPAEDLKLKSLATRNLWRQCVKCNHMIELAEGCYHMTCRCGNEFCYNCGAEWKDKKATCACPLWDEDNIWYDDNAVDSDEDLFDDDEYNEPDESDDDLFYRLRRFR